MRETLALYGGEKTTHEQFPAWPRFAERTFSDILEPLRSGRVASWSGTRTGELESLWASWAGAAHAVACSSGTAALHMALKALGIGPGDEVIVPRARSHRPPWRSCTPAPAPCSAMSAMTR